MSTRLDSSSGLIAGVLILGGFALCGTAPPPDAQVTELARHLSGARSRILAGDLLVATGAAFYLWFLAALREHLRPERVLSAAAFAAGAGAMTLVVAGVALQSALVLHEQPAATVRLGFDGYNALITIAGIGFALTVAGAVGSARRAGSLTPRLRAAGAAVALLQLLTLPGLVVGHGFFAPAAPMPVIAFWALTAWSAAVSVHMIRRASRLRA